MVIYLLKDKGKLPFLNVTLINPTTQIVEKGGKLNFIALVDAFPAPTVVWYDNNNVPSVAVHFEERNGKSQPELQGGVREDVTNDSASAGPSDSKTNNNINQSKSKSKSKQDDVKFLGEAHANETAFWLSLSNVKRSESGTYRIVVSAGDQNTSANFTLKVRGIIKNK